MPLEREREAKWNEAEVLVLDARVCAFTLERGRWRLPLGIPVGFALPALSTIVPLALCALDATGRVVPPTARVAVAHVQEAHAVRAEHTTDLTEHLDEVRHEQVGVWLAAQLATPRATEGATGILAPARLLESCGIGGPWRTERQRG